MKIRFFYILLILFSLCSCFSKETEQIINKVKELEENGKIHEAYKVYISHIENKLDKKENNQTKYNPFFYFILIGDMYLRNKNYDAALSSYLIARSRKIKKEIIVDRIQLIAKRYIKEKKYQKAWDLLEKYKNLDELSFSYQLSELHKKMVKEEQKNSE